MCLLCLIDPILMEQIKSTRLLCSRAYCLFTATDKLYLDIIHRILPQYLFKHVLGTVPLMELQHALLFIAVLVISSMRFLPVTPIPYLRSPHHPSSSPSLPPSLSPHTASVEPYLQRRVRYKVRGRGESHSVNKTLPTNRLLLFETARG